MSTPQKKGIEIWVNSSLDEFSRDLGLIYGRTFRDVDGGDFVEASEKDSFFTRMVKKVDKVYSGKHQLSDEEKEIIRNVSDVSKYLSSQVDASVVDNLKIQLNVNTPFNELVMKNPAIIGVNKSKTDSLQKDMGTSATHIYPKQGNMFIGLDAFKPGEELSDALHQHISLKENVEFTIFHEISHGVEYQNKRNHHDIPEGPIENILGSLDHLKYRDNLHLVNQSIKESYPDGNYAPIDAHIAENLSILKGEIYADVGGLLLQRNYKISKGEFSPESTHRMVEGVSQSRKAIFEANDHIDSALILNHHTSPGLDALKDDLDDLPERELLADEIHALAQKYTKAGMAKTIKTMIAAENQLIPQLKSLASMRVDLNPNSKAPLKVDDSQNHFLEMNKDIDATIGADWLNQFSRDAGDVQNLPTIQNKSKAVYYAGLHREAHLVKYAKAQKLQGDFDDLFGDDAGVVAQIDQQVESKNEGLKDNYLIARNGVKSDPVNFDTLSSMAASGLVRDSDLIWKVGEKDWTLAKDRADIAEPISHQLKFDVAVYDKQLGKLKQSEIYEMVESKGVKPDSLRVWQPGMEGWQLAKDHSAFNLNTKPQMKPSPYNDINKPRI